MKTVRFCMILLAVCMAAPARADMYGALRGVYLHNPVIAQQREILKGAAADVDLARSGYKPYLGVSANAGMARTQIMGQTYDYVPTQFGVEFQQNLFEGFSTLAGIKAAKGMLASQQAVLYSTQQDVFLDAINAYINVLNASEILKLNRNNQRVLQEYHDFVSENQNVGKLTKTDVASATARVEQARYNVIDAGAKYENAVETFRRIYGATEEEYTEINLDKMNDLFPDSITHAEEYALKNHPGLIALAAQEAAARENIVVARKTRMPSIDIKAAAMQLDDLPVVDRVRDGRVGVYFSLPLYDKGASSASVDKVRFTVASIGEQIINARRMVVENLRRAWNIYDAQTVAIDAARARIRAAQMALDGIRDEQARGRRTVLDVLNAEQEVLNSRVALATARHAKISAYFAVLSAVGKLNAENLGLTTED